MINRTCIFLLILLWSGILASAEEPEQPVAGADSAVVTANPENAAEQKIESDDTYYSIEGGAEQKVVYGHDFYLQRDETLHDIVGIHESIEGFNRVMFVCNDFIMTWIGRPIMKGYSFIVPKTGRKWINNIAKNVEFPVRMFSCFLQGRFADGGIDFSRFLINTTLGVAGVFDVAYDWFGMLPRDDDFGKAFASWGCGSGFYIMIPIHGPSSLRDGIGLIFDYAFDPKTWIPVPGIQAFCKMNESSLGVDMYMRFTRSCLDPYVDIRDQWYIIRQIEIRGPVKEDEAADKAEVMTGVDKADGGGKE